MEGSDKLNYAELARKGTEIKRKFGFSPNTVDFKYQMTPLLVNLPIHLTLYISTRTLYPEYPITKYGGAEKKKKIKLFLLKIFFILFFFIPFFLYFMV